MLRMFCDICDAEVISNTEAFSEKPKFVVDIKRQIGEMELCIEITRTFNGSPGHICPNCLASALVKIATKLEGRC